MIMNNNPLVSIVVITYNSSRYVLETLDSIKLQTYQNLELIVSDDCSTDNTVELCNNWLRENGKLFYSVELITSSNNTGISANCNRGMKLCSGEWVMLIAGDDLYTKDAVWKFVEYIDKYKQTEIVLSWCYEFTDSINTKRVKELYIPERNSKQQLLFMLKNDVNIAGCAIFANKLTLHTVGYYDENFRMFEDYPFIIKCLNSGIQISIIHSPLKYYRENSITSVSSNNSGLGDSIRKFQQEVYWKLLLKHSLYLRYWHSYVDQWMYKRGSRYYFLSIIMRLTDVYRWKKIGKIKKSEARK